ncbi:hypothetical protein [Clostridium peptidivorans]|uniref:hypothetical protein n=1 Tax=Clostridium peptidivorans TaxID=100174 RepID=UPI000BE3B64E|nr:hypothetical protein [Clostridium peptidivorans]
MYIDDFEEFDEFTEFQYLDDFRDNNTFRDFDDTEEIDEPNRNSFMCPAVCPFYRQFYKQSYRQFPHPLGVSDTGGPRQVNQPPSGPPPSVTPQEPVQTFAVDPGAIRGCLYKYVYIWPNRGSSFWMWLVYVGRQSIAGWRWDGRRWFYFGMDLKDIKSFKCY